MTTIDLSMTPYEFFIDMSYNFEYYDKISNIKCICKDVLLKTLDEIKDIENLVNYNVYICGKINSSSSFPTWDCDLTLENSEFNENELIEIFKQIKEIGLHNNLNFDLKFMRDIGDWNNCVDTPDDYFDVIQAGFFCDPSTNHFSVLEKSRNMRIRKNKNRFYTYYKALLIKKKGETELKTEGINFISNTILPDSNLRNSGMYDNRYSFRKLKPIDTTGFNEEEMAFYNSLK